VGATSTWLYHTSENKLDSFSMKQGKSRKIFIAKILLPFSSRDLQTTSSISYKDNISLYQGCIQDISIMAGGVNWSLYRSTWAYENHST
jgi:hypothetical protein